ncbi:hypothetical protein [Enterobacter roggenkampii]|uniref:hypothetical protein n=1 Tax=Enterobacter roggenkampii TaxID=1812935 RepID=UPI003BEF0099
MFFKQRFNIVCTQLRRQAGVVSIYELAQSYCGGESTLREVQFHGLLPPWFACEINHSHPRLPYRRPAERLHLMRVNLSTSSDCSYAVGGYFVGVLPWWFVVRLGDDSKSPLYFLVKLGGI